ncbi:MAG: SgcJ/EcaC family oxidoreductase [Planctomycetales bacterium]|nr:SgcJ/EcaC family oxidoreductase [Planctomycetales bacterium]
MTLRNLALTCCCLLPAQAVFAQPVAEPAAEAAIHERLSGYLDAFNENDADKVTAYWSADAVSVNDETGERTEGREALNKDFRAFFEQSPGARLTGQANGIRFIKPDVAVVEGEATLFVPGGEPSPSAFTAILVQEDGKWVLESSQERPLPAPPSPRAALEELSWLVGQWRDDTTGVEVNTTVRWSPNSAFLIRSYHADYGDGESFEGTQVIGWDPSVRQFRTWNFNSDGSFGEGYVTRSGDEFLVKGSQVQSDGGLATETMVITRVDQDTMRVEKIGRTLNGSPIPSSEPVTVRRVADLGSADAEGDPS